MNNSTKLFCPVRLLVYIPPFKDIHYRSRLRRYRIMRDIYDKKTHQLLTFEEIAEYLGIEVQQLISFLPEHERENRTI